MKIYVKCLYVLMSIVNNLFIEKRNECVIIINMKIDIIDNIIEILKILLLFDIIIIDINNEENILMKPYCEIMILILTIQCIVSIEEMILLWPMITLMKSKIAWLKYWLMKISVLMKRSIIESIRNEIMCDMISKSIVSEESENDDINECSNNVNINIQCQCILLYWY